MEFGRHAFREYVDTGEPVGETAQPDHGTAQEWAMMGGARLA